MHWPSPPAFLLRQPSGFAIVAATFAVLTAALAPFQNSQRLLAIALAYLLVTLIASAVWGYVVGVGSALAADLLVNFFFVPPIHKFTVQEPENVAALLVFLAVALVGASMLGLLRRQVSATQARRAETVLLLDLTQQVAHAVSPGDAMNRLCSAAARALGARECAILRDDGGWKVLACTGILVLSQDDRAMATQALESGGVVRFGRAASSRTIAPRQRSPESLTFVPFRSATRVRGVLRLSGPLHPPPLVDVARLLEAFADEAATAAEGARLSDEAGRVEALQRADEFKTAILSSVSHDLRSPLTAIKAAIGTLRDHTIEWADNDRDALLEAIESQTDRLTATVTGLLEMSRLEGGVVEPRLEPIDAALLLADVVQSAGTTVGDRSLDVNTCEACWFRGDYALLFQALVNLIENAAKYSTPRLPIHLRAQPTGDAILLEVGDEGPGISEKDLPHIFEKFYRGGESSRARGTGLGLSIVQAMVRLSGGSMGVKSAPTGTTFTITLPAVRAPAR